MYHFHITKGKSMNISQHNILSCAYNKEVKHLLHWNVPRVQGQKMVTDLLFTMPEF